MHLKSELNKLAETMSIKQERLANLRQELMQLRQQREDLWKLTQAAAWNDHELEGWVVAGKVCRSPDWQEPQACCQGQLQKIHPDNSQQPLGSVVDTTQQLKEPSDLDFVLYWQRMTTYLLAWVVYCL